MSQDSPLMQFFLVQDIRRHVLSFLHPSDCKALPLLSRQISLLYLNDEWYWCKMLKRYFAIRMEKSIRQPLASPESLSLSPSTFQTRDDADFSSQQHEPHYYRREFARQISNTRRFSLNVHHPFSCSDWDNPSKLSSEEFPLRVERSIGTREPVISPTLTLENEEEIGQILTFSLTTDASILSQIGEEQYAKCLEAAVVSCLNMFYPSVTNFHTLLQDILTKSGVSLLDLQSLTCSPAQKNPNGQELLERKMDLVSAFVSKSDDLIASWQETSQFFQVIKDTTVSLSKNKREAHIKLSIVESISEGDPFECFSTELHVRKMINAEDLRHFVQKEFQVTAATLINAIGSHALTSTGCLNVMMSSFIEFGDVFTTLSPVLQMLSLFGSSLVAANVSNYFQTQQVSIEFGPGPIPLCALGSIDSHDVHVQDDSSSLHEYYSDI